MAEGGRDYKIDDNFNGAASKGDCKTLQEWLDRGHNVNTRYGPFKSTALMAAAQNNHCSAISLLLKHNADINHQDMHGRTALMRACYRNALDAVKLLLSKSADINLRDKDNKNALFYILHPNTIVDPIKTTEDISRALQIIALLLDNGIDMTSPNKDNLTPIEFVRSKIGTGSEIRNQYYKEAESLLQKVEQKRNFDILLEEGQGIPIDTINLFIAGHEGVGKTTLKNTLLKTSQTEPAPDPGKEKEYTHTAGIDFSRAEVPGVGKINMVDMAGQGVYFATHSMFTMEADYATIALLYKGIDFDKDGKVIGIEKVKESAMKEVKQIIQMFISTNKGSSSKDTLKRILYVYLVATRGDWAEKYGYENEVRKLAREVIDEAAKMFSEHIGIFIGDEILVLNTHDPQSPDMKKLREILRMRKDEVMKNLKPMPSICGKIMELVTQWKKQQKLFPVLYWDDYLARVREGINPNLEEDYIKKATEHLHTVTELQYMKCSKTAESQDVIIIDVPWFGVRILGPMFATRIFLQFAKKLETKKIYPIEDIKYVLGSEADMDKLIQLLIDMEIIFPLGDKDYGGGHAGQFIIPNILQHIMPEDQWMMSQHINIYYGRRFICQRENDIFSPSFFPKLQARLHVSFTKLGCTPSGIWKNGIKVCDRVEALVFLSDDIRSVNIAVRCENKDQIGECYELLERLTYDVYQVLHAASPGVDVELHVLSAHSLKNHHDLNKVKSYSLQQIKDAEGKKAKVYQKELGIMEKVTDLMVPGFDLLFLKEKGIKCDVKWMTHQAKQEVINSLEQELDTGEDYRTMAQHMGISVSERQAMATKVQMLQKTKTEQLLDKWSANWETACQRDGPSAKKNERKPYGEEYYESTVENLMKINKKYLHKRDVECALNDMVQNPDGKPKHAAGDLAEGLALEGLKI